jgi:hypothetical protein
LSWRRSIAVVNDAIFRVSLRSRERETALRFCDCSGVVLPGRSKDKSSTKIIMMMMVKEHVEHAGGWLQIYIGISYRSMYIGTLLMIDGVSLSRYFWLGRKWESWAVGALRTFPATRKRLPGRVTVDDGSIPVLRSAFVSFMRCFCCYHGPRECCRDGRQHQFISLCHSWNKSIHQ